MPIMQLSCCPPFILHIARTLLSLLSNRFLYASPPILPCILHVVHVPRYLIYISLFYYSSYWRRFPKGRCAPKGSKFYYAIVLNFPYIKFGYHGSRSKGSTIYFVLFVGKRRTHKICVLLLLNLIILRGTMPVTPVYSHTLFIQSSHL